MRTCQGLMLSESCGLFTMVGIYPVMNFIFISINFVQFHISNPKPEQNFYIIFYIFATDGLILVFISVKRRSVHSEG